MRRDSLFIALLILGLTVGVAAQPVSNPRFVEFFPSADHNVTLPGGQAAVTRYDFEIYAVGASAPTVTQSLGKPIPGTDGLIRYDFSGQIVGWPIAYGVTYESRVAAVGPQGTGRSSLSNQFAFAASCTFTISPTAVTAVSTGQTFAVSVTASGPSCAWAVTGGPSWATVSPTSGTGTGTVTVVVAANTTTSQRTGTATIGGQALSITQAAPPVCTYSVSPTTATVPAEGQTVPVSLTTLSGCAWTATGPTWVVIAPTSGTGPATVGLTVQSNPATTTRTGQVTVGGQVVEITQVGAAPCTQTVTPAVGYVDAAGGAVTFTVATGAACSWGVGTDVQWLTFNRSTGVGPNTVIATAVPNTGSPRSASVTIGDKTVVVSQAGAPAAPTEVKIYALVAASTGEIVATLTNGGTIRLAALSTQQVSLRATTVPEQVGSVALVYDRVRTVDNSWPYELEYASGFRLKAGTHTVVGTPYADANLGGASGTPLTLKFNVVKR